MIMSVNFIFSFFSIYLFIYLFIYLQGRSENHFCDNASCLKIIIITRQHSGLGTRVHNKDQVLCSVVEALFEAILSWALSIRDL